MIQHHIQQIDLELERLYPAAECSLRYEGEPWKLLVMARLSAQCTDERVNVVCGPLFARYPTPEAMADAELSELETLVKPCGLYKGKARNLKDACSMLVRDYGGELPETAEELLRFPGVGRKIANLLAGDLFGQGGIVADTHCIRLCGRFGVYDEALKDPLKVEKILDPLLPRERQSDFCHRLVLFGREWCTARAPKCETCPIRQFCAHFAARK